MATPAVTAQVPAEATAAFPIRLTELTAPETAAASGNAAWAMGHLTSATTHWATLRPANNARVTSQARLLFDNLGAKLDAGTPTSQLHNPLAGTTTGCSAGRSHELTA